MVWGGDGGLVVGGRVGGFLVGGGGSDPGSPFGPACPG